MRSQRTSLLRAAWFPSNRRPFQSESAANDPQVALLTRQPQIEARPGVTGDISNLRRQLTQLLKTEFSEGLIAEIFFDDLYGKRVSEVEMWTDKLRVLKVCGATVRMRDVVLSVLNTALCFSC